LKNKQRDYQKNDGASSSEHNSTFLDVDSSETERALGVSHGSRQRPEKFVQGISEIILDYRADIYHIIIGQPALLPAKLRRYDVTSA
jgi:hypothetical protein